MSFTLLLSARSVSARAFQSLQSTWAFHQLERRLNRLLMLAEDHQAAGVSNDDVRLVQLYRQALEEVDRYCSNWDQALDRLVAELPALSRLERLAEKKSSSAASILLASFTGAALLGLTLGLCHVAYILVAHLAQ